MVQLLQVAATALALLGSATHEADVPGSHGGISASQSAILEAVQRIAHYQPRRGSAHTTGTGTLSGKLQPSMRRAMRVVAHPHAFFDGYFPEELKAPAKAGSTPRKKRRMRRRRRKRGAVAVSGFAGLEQRSAEDGTLHAAVQEFKWKDSLARHAAAALLPRQRVLGSHVDRAAVGAVSRRLEHEG